MSPGELIGGKYEVVRLRGQGGNGSVYEAQNVLTGKRVAVKWLRASQATYEGARERMLREAQSAARVRHRNVVDIYDVGFDDGVIYLVMELLEGETLAELLTSRTIEIHRLIALLIPALRGVAAAHRSGVIHRDLKPENLFLARDPEHAEPRCVVLDFGVAKLSGSAALTTPGFAVGTPIFMPVEQLVGGATVDERSDVHALGVILYVALTGRSPYEGETLRDMAMQMLTVEPVPVQRLRPDVPFELCLTVQRSMSKQPSERPANVEALIADLLPYATAEGEAWGKARNLCTRIVPIDLGTPGSRELDDAPRVTQESVPAVPMVSSSRSWWLAAAAVGVALGIAAWPSEDRTPRAAPSLEQEAGVVASEPARPAPEVAPARVKAPEPQREDVPTRDEVPSREVHAAKTNEPPRRVRAARAVAPPEAAKPVEPARPARVEPAAPKQNAMTVDEFAIEE